MSKKLKIVDIRRQPFWKIDQWEVTVEINGETKKLSIYEKNPTCSEVSKKLFLEYVRNKAVYGVQWTDDVKKVLRKRQKIDELGELRREFIGKELEVDP